MNSRLFYKFTHLPLLFILGLCFFSQCFAQIGAKKSIRSFPLLEEKLNFSIQPELFEKSDMKRAAFPFTFPRFDIINAELPYLIGIEAGPTLNFISGTYNNYATSCDYSFTNGTGPGFFLDFIGTIPLDYGTNIEITAGFSQSKISSTHTNSSMRVIRGEPDPTPINMEGKASFELSFLNISASIKQNILINDLYILGGIRFMKGLDETLEVTEAIKDPGFAFGGSYKTEDYLFRKSDLPGKNEMLFTLQAGLLYEIPIFGDYILAPKINFIYPLNSLLQDNSFKTISINFGLQFLYSY